MCVVGQKMGTGVYLHVRDSMCVCVSLCIPEELAPKTEEYVTSKIRGTTPPSI